MAHSMSSVPRPLPRSSAWMRTPSTIDLVAPRRESPGMIVSWSVPTTLPSLTATTRRWFGSAPSRSSADR